MTSYRFIQRALSGLAALIALSAVMFEAQAQSLPAPLPGTRVLESGNTSVTHGAMSNLFVPAAGTFYIDYAIEPGKELILTMVTAAQYQAISAGRKAEGQPVMKYIVSGSGRHSVTLERGNYHLAFTGGGSGTRLSYRGSLK